MNKQQLLEDLADSPRWIYARALLSATDSVLTEVGEGQSILVSSARYSLGVLIGMPDRTLLQEAVQAPRDPFRLLASTESSGATAAALPAWRSAPAIVHTLGSDGLLVASPRAPVDILRLHEVLSLDGWPEDLRQELGRGDPAALAAVARGDDGPAAICHVAFETESLWDVSIETLEPFRRRGLAESCAVQLIQEMHRHGKMPVWGAEAQNVPSLRLAWKLGFIPSERFVLFSPPEIRRVDDRILHG